MAQYALEIKSRNLYFGPEQKNFSELFDFSIQVDFSDDSAPNHAFVVEIRSDLERWLETVDFVPAMQYMGDLGAIDKIRVRHNIQLVPQCGFYGSFFRFDVTKTCPTDGFFNWNGCTLAAIPLNVDQEFMATFDNIVSGE